MASVFSDWFCFNWRCGKGSRAAAPADNPPTRHCGDGRQGQIVGSCPHVSGALVVRSVQSAEGRAPNLSYFIYQPAYCGLCASRVWQRSLNGLCSCVACDVLAGSSVCWTSLQLGFLHHNMCAHRPAWQCNQGMPRAALLAGCKHSASSGVKCAPVFLLAA